MLTASTFNPSTVAVCEVGESYRILDTPGSLGPKWRYELRLVGLKWDASVYSIGDVTKYSPATQDPTVFTGYNSNELDNTPTTWFGLASTEYKGLEFNPCPGGQIVLAVSVPFEMLDSQGAYSTGAPDHVALFTWPNQLSGTCS